MNRILEFFQRISDIICSIRNIADRLIAPAGLLHFVKMDHLRLLTRYISDQFTRFFFQGQQGDPGPPGEMGDRGPKV